MLEGIVSHLFVLTHEKKSLLKALCLYSLGFCSSSYYLIFLLHFFYDSFPKTLDKPQNTKESCSYSPGQ